MHVDKSLIQKKAKFYLSELRGWNTFFTWWSCAFFKVTYSGQKLNYKDSLPSPWHGSVGYSLRVCQLSCPCPEPAQLCKIAVPCAKQKQVVETHPPEHSGTVWFSFPTTSASLTPRLWQTRQHSPMQYPAGGVLPAWHAVVVVMWKFLFQLPYTASFCFFGLYFHLFYWRCDCNLGCKSCIASVG